MPQLKMLSLTVVTKKTRYSANHLTVSLQHPGWRSVLTFVCSGSLTTVPAEDVIAIEVFQNGAHWCNACDQPLPANVIYDLQHPEREPAGE